jgi:hypothetical protein
MQLKLLNKYTYLFKGSYSKNFGTYDVPFSNNNKGISQKSIQNALQFFNKKGIIFNINWTMDIGLLYQSSNGIYFSVKKNW